MTCEYILYVYVRKERKTGLGICLMYDIELNNAHTCTWNLKYVILFVLSD